PRAHPEENIVPDKQTGVPHPPETPPQPEGTPYIPQSDQPAVSPETPPADATTKKPEANPSVPTDKKSGAGPNTFEETPKKDVPESSSSEEPSGQTGP